MTPEEKLDLAKKHAPILWLHEKEAFFPVDGQRMVDICDFYRKDTRVPDNQQPRNLDELGGISKSDECSLKIPDIDLKNFQVNETDRERFGLSGPEAVMELAREKYGHDFMANGIPAIGIDRPKYYYRVSMTNIQKRRDDRFTKVFERKDPKIFGQYTHVEYFFFFVYNDSWNQHQGDWDAMVELYIKNDRTYLIYHLHTEKWLTFWPKSPQNITDWINRWQSLRKGGNSYVINGHPFLFIAQGAHGGYPTPGFSLHGADIPGLISKNDFLADSDMRQIGRGCILPPDINEDDVRNNLETSGIDSSRLVFGRWADPELIDNQPWLNYKGRWGEKVNLLGWDAPKSPPVTKNPNHHSLRDTIFKNYKSGSVIRNWHGI